VERVRHELLTALHFGRLTPGDRVPSVRRLADLTGINRKTVHRAYSRLAEEGLLDLRPGSGTFVTERLGAGSDATSVNDLVLAANRSRAMAERLGISPAVFGLFVQIVMGDGLRGLPLAVAECNGEQLGLIELALREATGVRTRPVLLRQLSAAPQASLRGVFGVVTTHCHGAEITEIAAPWGVPVYRVALDPAFPQRLTGIVSRGPVVMVVRDRGFAPVFLRLLSQLSGRSDLGDRLRIVEPRETRRALRELGADATLVVSPLVAGELGSLTLRVRSQRLRWRLEPGSIERFRVSVALDLASGRLAETDEPAVRSSLGR
jgi:DNA-binding transcriptional regulator YhcF (GntR family)